MMRTTLLTILLLALSARSSAQVALPPLGEVLGEAGGRLGDMVRPVTSVVQSAGALARTRIDRLTDFVVRNNKVVEFDLLRQPARRGELLVVDPDAVALRGATQAGYRVIEQGTVDGLDVPFARLAVPEGRTLAKAQRELKRLLPEMEITADQIHFASASPKSGTGGQRVQGTVALPVGGQVGVIDGGVRPDPAIAAQAGFASGAPRPNAHAQAIRSLLAGAGVERVYAADVYGSDPAGGNALAIAKALGWMVQQGAPVISISLVGPANPLLARAVASARARGVTVVAAVGNDGPAAPSSYPASYAGVIAVTGVDRKGKVLFEAGNAAHLDYAAPGADMTVIGLNGRRVPVRGTSFAAPLAAARIAANRAQSSTSAAALVRTNAEVRAAGPRAGRGILCDSCREGR